MKKNTDTYSYNALARPAIWVHTCTYSWTLTDFCSTQHLLSNGMLHVHNGYEYLFYFPGRQWSLWSWLHQHTRQLHMSVQSRISVADRHLHFPGKYFLTSTLQLISSCIQWDFNLTNEDATCWSVLSMQGLTLMIAYCASGCNVFVSSDHLTYIGHLCIWTKLLTYSLLMISHLHWWVSEWWMHFTWSVRVCHWGVCNKVWNRNFIMDLWDLLWIWMFVSFQRIGLYWMSPFHRHWGMHWGKQWLWAELYQHSARIHLLLWHWIYAQWEWAYMWRWELICYK